ncbi:MAG: DUF3644 domain-containing protein [Verrucomicrobia bacterium]|nr:DUF3644 domain-containing protein [Verrucomicrobiota bacterium]
MKGHRGNPGLKGRLLEKSIEGYILALETINRLSIKYRVETFCYLICNAWELLLKAKILNDAGNDRNSIYRGNKKRGERRESVSLRECLDRVIPTKSDAERRNIECIAELRDEAVHLVISDVPTDVLGLFQACVINYHRRLNEWFCVSLSDRVHVGMMSLVYDLGPHRGDMNDKRLRRALGREAADYLTRYCAQIRNEFDALQRPVQFSIDIEYRLALTKNHDDADIVLFQGSAGAAAVQIVEVPKDSSRSHPYRQKEVIQRVKAAVPGLKINQHDIQCVKKAYSVKQRPEYFYQGKVKGSPVQYSQHFVNWLILQHDRDGEFFAKARVKAKGRS